MQISIPIPTYIVLTSQSSLHMKRPEQFLNEVPDPREALRQPTDNAQQCAFHRSQA